MMHGKGKMRIRGLLQHPAGDPHSLFLARRTILNGKRPEGDTISTAHLHMGKACRAETS